MVKMIDDDLIICMPVKRIGALLDKMSTFVPINWPTGPLIRPKIIINQSGKRLICIAMHLNIVNVI